MKKNNKATFPTEAISIPELPVSIDPKATDSLVLQKASGTNSLTIQELANLILASEIGGIRAFAYDDVLPLEYLECNGNAYAISSYQELWFKIGELYDGDDPPPNGQFRVPNLHNAQGLGLFLRQYDQLSVGTVSVDTMRKIKGEIKPVSDFGADISAGAFKNSTTGSNVGLAGGGGKENTINAIFDSSLGIEGQEGLTSPNVGIETAPASIRVKFGIRAKAFIDQTLAENVKLLEERRAENEARKKARIENEKRG